MLTRLEGQPEELIRLRASGTVLATDVSLAMRDLPARAHLIVVLDPDFDGYLAEISRGLAAADCARCALIVPDDMLVEARIHADTETFRTFPASERGKATMWAAA